MEKSNEPFKPVQPNDPRLDPAASEEVDPHSGASDDPRVDPTPDRRQSDTSEPDVNSEV